MNEHPILFSSPMVSAILDGRKTITRRVVNPQPRGPNAPGLILDFFNKRNKWVGAWSLLKHSGNVQSPYGQPGDRLWVRETWGLWDTQPSDGPERAQIFYRATDGEKHYLRNQLWRPSIFMPRWASRITLEITGVRVERLIDITALDCRREGFIGETYGGEDPYSWFRRLWNSINGKKYPWNSNPWVWVIEFRRISA